MSTTRSLGYSRLILGTPLAHEFLGLISGDESVRESGGETEDVGWSAVGGHCWRMGSGKVFKKWE